jgi:hypothetical protein
VYDLWNALKLEIEERADIVEQTIPESRWERDWKEGEMIVFDRTNR